MYAMQQKWLQQRQSKSTPRILACSLAAFFVVWVWAWHRPYNNRAALNGTAQLDKYVAASIGLDGRWFIPRSWYQNMTDFQPVSNLDDYMDLRNPRSPAEAAHQALELALRHSKFLENSKIPMIIHQTWKDCESDHWPQQIRQSVNAWIAAATGEESGEEDFPQMAYILWDDNAIARFFALYEPELWAPFNKLALPVEKSDLFRVAVLKWFGGVYADLDTLPLEHPSQWVHNEDLMRWQDRQTGNRYELYRAKNESYICPSNAPVRPHPFPDSDADYTPASYSKFMTNHAPHTIDVAAILGLEADTRPERDDYWRAGYSYPVQLTNWAFAMAPQHPIAISFLKQAGADIESRLVDTMVHVDPLELTGPPAVTRVVKQYSEEENHEFKWESVTGLDDPVGGRGKVVAGDILVLPITGFSPGRGSRNNMGSQSVEHPNARLMHAAQGSWRKTSLKVTTGKLCRTLLGRCKEWRKVP